MINEIATPIEDHHYTYYQNKQWESLTYERLLIQSNNVKKANHYSIEQNNWIVKPYYGFGMISMLNQYENNSSLSHKIIGIQQNLISLIEDKTKSSQYENIYLLPEYSFHQTIANGLSKLKYDQQIISKHILDTYPNKIQEILLPYKSILEKKIIEMKMIGMTILGNAIVMLGVFNDSLDYHSILNFRNYFYNHVDSKSMGIQMTRPFMGHITIAYIESDLSIIEKEVLAESIHQLNELWKNEAHFFYIENTQLTSFIDLSSFIPIPDIKPINF